MAAGPWTFTNNGRQNRLNGSFAIGTDTFKVALFLSTSNLGPTSDLYSGLTNEHANANGYLTGGVAATVTLAGTISVTTDIVTDPAWTAAGGSITARFAVLYKVGGKILAYSLLDTTPADVTATTGNSLTVAIDPLGVFVDN